MVLSSNTNLWLAEILWRLGAIEFGEFSLGRTAVGSPIYVNVRKLIGHPTALWRAAHVIHEEITALQSMVRPPMAIFDLVAGVPLGGLHVATAYSLTAKIPMIYYHPVRTGGDLSALEGVYEAGQRAIIMDDLVTGGGSILETAQRLRESGLIVRDAFVIVDRQQGARDRLKADGINLHAALSLDIIVNYLMSSELIEEQWYRRCVEYLDANRA